MEGVPEILTSSVEATESECHFPVAVCEHAERNVQHFYERNPRMKAALKLVADGKPAAR